MAFDKSRRQNRNSWSKSSGVSGLPLALAQMENETVTHSWGFAVGSKSSIAVIVEISTIQGKMLLANLKKKPAEIYFFSVWR